MGFGGGNLRERDHLEDPGVDASIILMMDIQEVGCGCLDWLELAQGCCECDNEHSGSIM